MEHVHIAQIFLIVFASAFVGGFIAKRIGQPMLIGYILSGIVFGAVFSGALSHSIIGLIAESGITLLLFAVGVELSFHRLRTMISYVSLPSIVQIAFMCIIGYLGLRLAGFSYGASLYIATALSLSSTAVALRMLSDRQETATPHGNLAVGWLIIQDLSVVLYMTLLPALVAAGSDPGGGFEAIGLSILRALLTALALIAGVLVLGHYVVPWFLDRIAALKSRELFLITVIGLVFILATFAVSVGLSAPLGAFLAGLLIAQTSKNHAVFAEIRPLRDIFAAVFFVAIGASLPVARVGEVLIPSLILIALVFAVRMLLVNVLLRKRAFHRKTAFLTGILLLPMSEFGFVLARDGIRLGALSEYEYTLLSVVTFGSMLIAAPFMGKGTDLFGIYRKTMGRVLPKFFKETTVMPEEQDGMPLEDHVVICGYGRVGKYVGRALELMEIPFVVVEISSAIVSSLEAKGIRSVYGDPSDIHVLDYAQVDHARAVVVAVPDIHSQQLIISNAKNLNKDVKIYCRTHHESDLGTLKSLGVTGIIQPEFEASLSMLHKLLGDYNIERSSVAGKISRLKIEHGIGS